MTQANYNRGPAEYRAATATLPVKNPRPYRSAHWPLAERLQYEDGGTDMIRALLGWRDFTAPPRMCVANDNFAGDDYEGEEELVRFNYDNRLLQDTADHTVALHDAGKPWEPDPERFTQPHRNDPSRSIPADTYVHNGVTMYQGEADAESEMIRKVDESSARLRLGHVCARLLDLASSDSTRADIALGVRHPVSDRIDIYVDWSIIRWMRDPAFHEYVAAA